MSEPRPLCERLADAVAVYRDNGLDATADLLLECLNELSRRAVPDLSGLEALADEMSEPNGDAEVWPYGEQLRECIATLRTQAEVCPATWEAAYDADTPKDGKPETKAEVWRPIERFIVKHYVGDESPSIKGNGFDGLRVGDDRQEAEEFVAWLNARFAPLPPGPEKA